MAEMMKAQIVRAPYQMEYTEVPVPEINDDEVLIKVKVCGICGSDWSIYTGNYSADKLPMITGHEFWGEIAKVGKNSKGLKVGDRVAVDICLTCGTCYFCRHGDGLLCESFTQLGIHTDGGFAEYVKAPWKNCYLLPDELDDYTAAFVEPLTAVLHASQRMDAPMASSLAVIGCGLGILHASLGKARGMAPVIVIGDDPRRLKTALEMGADYVVDISKTPDAVAEIGAPGTESGNDPQGQGDRRRKGCDPFSAGSGMESLQVRSCPESDRNRQPCPSAGVYRRTEDRTVRRGYCSNRNCSGCRQNWRHGHAQFRVHRRRYVSGLIAEEILMNEPLTFYPRHPSSTKTHKIETQPMPILPQEAPFDVKSLFDVFSADLHGALAVYEDKRFEVTGVAVKVGPDVHNKPSIEISDCAGGQTYALTIFPTDDHYSKVSVGDRVTVRANYLVFCNWFGVVLKHSELVHVEKADV